MNFIFYKFVFCIYILKTDIVEMKNELSLNNHNIESLKKVVEKQYTEIESFHNDIQYAKVNDYMLPL